jgi:hypothetical protein
MNGKLMYRCDLCDEVHEHEFQAEDCCPPSVSEVWVCETCESTNWDLAEADACCQADGPEAYQRRVAELEACGQQRLVE